MKIYFGKQRCPDCGYEYDKTHSACPHCGRRNDDRGASFFDHMLHIHPLKQMGFVLLSLVGLFLLVQISGAIAGATYLSSHPGAATEDLTAYLRSAEGLFWTDIPAYIVLFVAMAALLFFDWKPLLKSFAHWKPYVWGVGGFLAILAFTVLYNLSLSGIYSALGRPMPGSTNENQSLLNLMIMFNPAVCIIIFGIIGPFTEELGYRVGLFGLASRLGKALGYVVGTIVFALIHFDFGAFGDPAALERELITLPSYLFSGFAFSFLYARGGFAASYTAHMINNVVSVVQNYLEISSHAS